MPTSLHRLPLLIAVSLSLLAQHTYSQSGCAIELDEVDPFTKERVVCVVPSAPSGGPLYRWHAVDKNKTLKLTWSAPGNAQMVVLEGDMLYLLLETDSVVQLYSVSTEVGAYKVDDQGKPSYTGTYTFGVPNEVLPLLQRSWVVRIRMYHTTGYQDFVAEKDTKWQSGFANTLDCFLSTCSAGRPMPANAVLGQSLAPVSGR